jgi:4-amino-4-deoxy-L-arabinose transferase-like glycosyltransferase
VEGEGGNREVSPPSIFGRRGDLGAAPPEARLEEEGGPRGKHGFPRESEPKARDGASNRRALSLVAAAAVLPRLTVLFYERNDILTAFTEKSDDFAKTFVDHGTFGFLPGEPSAYTQPFYGFFLVPLYAIFGRHWLVVGLAQTAVALGVALLVYEIGRRILSPRAGLIAAVIATLNPYLVWHDVHVNREILDQLVAAGFVLATLIAVQSRSWPWAAVAGALAGLGILGNSRLVLAPVVLAVYLLARLGRRAWAAAAILVACAAVAVAPWLIRNRVELGCWALTTDARALWKANNLQTYPVLTSGGWIDDVKDPPGHPFPNPEEARDLYRATGKKVHVTECANMRYYQRKVREFWREHPGAKAELALLAARMEWDPRPTKTATESGHGLVRGWVQPIYTSLVLALALIGLAFVPRAFAALVLALLAYETVAAMAFVGATRYRVSWDFLIALLAAAAIERGYMRWRAR